MTFAQPELLAGLLLVPAAIALYLFIQRRRARYAVRFTNVDLLANLVPKPVAWRRHVPMALYLSAIVALAIGLARPSMVVAVPRDEATIILTMDVSGSMKATDVDPSRLAAAKKAASDFIDKLPDRFRVGLVAFSTEARQVLSPTTDKAAVHQAIDGLEAAGGTALGDAITVSLQTAGLDPSAPGAQASPAPQSSAPASPSPTVAPSPSGTPSTAPGTGGQPLVATVLLSDGKSSTGTLDPQAGADQAAALGVPVYTIALGTDAGIVTLPDRQGIPRTLNVPPDPETLAAIAETTGGAFFQAPTADQLAEIYRSLGSRVGFTNEEQEVTYLFAGAGLLFVLAGAGLAAHWFNRFP